MWKLACALVLAGCTAALGQCPEAWHPSGLRVGLEDAVLAMTRWDPDGAGPRPERLVVGGDFDRFPARHVAVLEGEEFAALGTGIGGRVYALADLGGQLIAGGDFDEAGGAPARAAARWDGASWSAMPGIGAGVVRALVVHGGTLYAGLTSPGSGVVRWDGAEWQPLGAIDGQVWALAVHAGQLVAAGPFSGGVKRWTGSAWEAVGTFTNSQVYPLCLAEYDGELWMGGAGYFGHPPLWRFDGTEWLPMGTFDLGGGVHDVTVASLRAYGGELIVGGDFTTLGVEAGLARWDGASWRSVCEGLYYAGSWASAMEVVGNDLYFGGLFSRVGSMTANCVARFDGSGCANPVGPPIIGLSYRDETREVEAAASFAGNLVIGGGNLAIRTAQGEAEEAARWDGLEWRPMAGLEGSIRFESMLTHQGELWAFGFLRAGGAATGAARWNGSAWLPTEGAGSVDAVAVHEGSLYAAGYFPFEHRLTRWNGSAWEVVALVPGQTSAMVAHGGELYLAAYTGFSPTLLRLEGSTLEPMAQPDQAIRTMASFGDLLLVGGALTTIDGVSVPHVAAWDGTSWMPMGAGITDPVHLSGHITRLHVHGGELFASGYEGGQVLSRWIPAAGAWAEIPGFGGGPGNAAMPEPLASHHGMLIVGGGWMGPTTVDSPGVAFWGRGEPACYANCDCSGSPALTVADFGCFMQRFAAGDAYANCDRSTTAPVLNVADFSCFLRSFAAGCD